MGPRPCAILTLYFFAMSSSPAAAQPTQCTIEQFTNSLSVSTSGAKISLGSDWMALNASGGSFAGFEILRANRRTGEIFPVTNSAAYDGNPDIDASGNWIVFESQDNLTGNNADGNREIVLHSVVEGTFMQITDSDQFPNFRPKISRDGQRILFRSSNDFTGENPLNETHVFFYDVSKGAIEQVVESFAWGTDPDLHWLVFATDDDPLGENPEGNEETFRLNLLTDELIQITHTTSGGTVGTSTSLDGRRIALISDSEDLIGPNFGLNEVLIFDLDQGTTQQLSAVQPNSISALISGDGRRIVAQLRGAVVLYDLESGETIDLVEETPLISGFSSIDLVGEEIALRSQDNLTGTNSDFSFETFLVHCDRPYVVFEDGFEDGTLLAWSRTVFQVPSRSTGR